MDARIGHEDVSEHNSKAICGGTARGVRQRDVRDLREEWPWPANHTEVLEGKEPEVVFVARSSFYNSNVVFPNMDFIAD